MSSITWKGWEGALVAQHELYRRYRLGMIAHVPAHAQQIGPVTSDGTFRARWTKKGATDFVGFMVGCPVFFDAKLCSGPRWTLRGRGGLEVHQERQLRQVAEMGGLAFVALYMGGSGWFVPYQAIRDSELKSWSLAQVGKFGSKIDGADWFACYTSCGR